MRVRWLRLSLVTPLSRVTCNCNYGKLRSRGNLGNHVMCDVLEWDQAVRRVKIPVALKFPSPAPRAANMNVTERPGLRGYTYTTHLHHSLTPLTYTTHLHHSLTPLTYTTHLHHCSTVLVYFEVLLSVLSVYANLNISGHDTKY